MGKEVLAYIFLDFHCDIADMVLQLLLWTTTPQLLLPGMGPSRRGGRRDGGKSHRRWTDPLQRMIEY